MKKSFRHVSDLFLLLTRLLPNLLPPSAFFRVDSATFGDFELEERSAVDTGYAAEVLGGLVPPQNHRALNT